MTEGELTLREASHDDCRFYWEVNNAPSTRALSIRTEPIPWDSHQGWFAARLSDPTSRLLVAEHQGERIGVVRFDGNGSFATISVALQPSQQGRGLGRRLIADATRAALDSAETDVVIALIRPDNEGSVRAFEAAGYVAAGQDESDGVTLLRYEAR